MEVLEAVIAVISFWLRTKQLGAGKMYLLTCNNSEDLSKFVMHLFMTLVLCFILQREIMVDFFLALMVFCQYVVSSGLISHLGR